MNYPIRTRNGDIGEHLVAFKIKKLLRWPCRLFDVDLGVDAEVEILDEAGNTTGDIIKIQIKSRENLGANNLFSIPVDENHIHYWKRFCAPVVFCAVDLDSEEVFWKQITALDDYDTDGVSKKVNFSKTKDKLSAATKPLWQALCSPASAHELSDLFKAYQVILEKTTLDAGDLETAHDRAKMFTDAEMIMGKIKNLISIVPWKINGEQLTYLKHGEFTLRTRDANNDQFLKEYHYY